MVTKTALLEELRRSGREVIETLRELPSAVLEKGRYESGWNGREILAHIASIEWTYPRLLAIASEPSAGQAASGAAAQGGIDAYNERQVGKRASASASELLAEFEKNRAATIAAVEGADDSLFERPIRSAGGLSGTLAEVLHEVAVEHVEAHLRDILGRREP